MQTVAFPAISTGIYGYPPAEAARVSSGTIEKFLRGDSGLREVRLIFFAPSDAETFLKNHVFTA